MRAGSAAEQVARNAGLVSLVALAALSVMAWLYLWSGAGIAAMPGMSGGAQRSEGVAVAAMWAAMMVAMMLPSAAPTVLLFATVQRRSGAARPPHVGAFAAGYLLCWTGFAIVATILHLALEAAALASPSSMALTSRPAAAAVLLAAGIYQLSPFKNACLGKCRSPAQFLARHYRPGVRGAARLGLLHGAYCVGCCWMLMALLFVGGVMNLAWIALLTLVVAAEKLLPGGPWIARIGGVALIGWAGALILR